MFKHYYLEVLVLLATVVSSCIAPSALSVKTAMMIINQSDGSITDPNLLEDSQHGTRICSSHTYDTGIQELLGARSAQVEMLTDNQVKIEQWSYRPERMAIEQNRPIPTPPPDGYDLDFLPTDYEIYQYNLTTNKLFLVEEQSEPFRNDYCKGACEQQLLSSSPDGNWQLVSVTDAWSEIYKGFWLVHRKHFQKQIAPFYPNQYPPSQAWWDWQNDSTGLFLTYGATGEIPSTPLYIRLSLPPAYSFLMEGVPLADGLSFNRTIVVNDKIILLYVAGNILQADGSQIFKQWYIYRTRSGTLQPPSTVDFISYAKYVLLNKEGSLHLVPWNATEQKKWIAEHPDEDIWNTLGNTALYTEPYQTQNDVFRIPINSDQVGVFQLIDCPAQ